jgi:NAD(P)-dependent dehydrogenase (short-subunit alcohol dehydrogenase family)
LGSPFYGHFSVSPNRGRHRSFSARKKTSYYAAAGVAAVPALRSFARNWAVDLKGMGIRVNAVSPGVIPTPGYYTSLGMTEQQLAARPRSG